MSRFFISSFVLVALLLPFAPVKSFSGSEVQSDPPRLIAWNDLGMHCIDPDFSVFSILPPFNTVDAQLVVNGKLLTSGQDYVLTYESMVDSSGSINTTSIGKTNFWDHEDDLFGVSLPLDVGLAGKAMPGAANTPQSMDFDTNYKWFHADGIPMTPIDDASQMNPYPLMKIVARDLSGNIIAQTVTTVPNSQELTCHMCHSSRANPYVRPAAGWANDPDPLRDDRLNILRLHDEKHLGEPVFDSALASLGFDPLGLYETAVTGGKAVLCASCHGSNALVGTGVSGITPLTVAIHNTHADALTPDGKRLDDVPTRESCFTCHPGFDTQCLRGAMGKAIGPDGKQAMHCQSCHGGMADVASPNRVGWLDEPTCQQCHTGTATNNSGAIRFDSVFDALGQPHVPASNVFATEPDVPATGHSLYRFSRGHGDLQCAACHGPPHAIYPTAIANDNEQSIAIQGHVGVISDCSACHGNLEDDELNLGPHGMHAASQQWAHGKHSDHAENDLASCKSCHGADLRGTELSRAAGDRVFQTPFGQKEFWRGFEVGCYDCHQGPTDDDMNNNQAPSVPATTSLATPNDTDLVIPLAGSDAEGPIIAFRIVNQPKFRTGTVALAGSTATFIPDRNFQGNATFEYAAYDGDTWSNLGLVTVTVGPPVCEGEIIEYGFGSPGAGGNLAHFSAEGCPVPGGNLNFALSNVLGGSYAVVLFGLVRDDTEVFPQLVRLVDNIALISEPIGLTGMGPGQGGFTGAATLPVIPPPFTLRMQAFTVDPAAPASLASSNGLEIIVR